MKNTTKKLYYYNSTADYTKVKNPAIHTLFFSGFVSHSFNLYSQKTNLNLLNISIF